MSQGTTDDVVLAEGGSSDEGFWKLEEHKHGARFTLWTSMAPDDWDEIAVPESLAELIQAAVEHAADPWRHREGRDD